VRTGEKIAGAAGIALILIMFIFKWYGIEAAGIEIPDADANAWEAFSLIDLILFVTAVAAIGLAYLSASQQRVDLPVAASAIVAGLGILSTILVIYRILDTPGDLGAAGEIADIDITREIGVWLGLIASAALTYGAWRAMQEEGTSLGAEADRLQDRYRGSETAERPATETPPPPPASSGEPPQGGGPPAA
jgi:hypothetical protein